RSGPSRAAPAAGGGGPRPAGEAPARAEPYVRETGPARWPAGVRQRGGEATGAARRGARREGQRSGGDGGWPRGDVDRADGPRSLPRRKEAAERLVDLARTAGSDVLLI